MNTDIILFVVFLAAVLGAGACLGKYMYLVFTNRPVLEKVFGPIERVLYAIGGVKHAEKEEMNWKQYTAALLIFSRIQNTSTRARCSRPCRRRGRGVGVVVRHRDARGTIG